MLQTPPRRDRSTKFAAFPTCPSVSISAKDFGGLHSAFKQLIAEIYNSKHPVRNESSPSSPPPAAAASTDAD